MNKLLIFFEAERSGLQDIHVKDDEGPPTLSEEVNKAIMEMKFGKAIREDGIFVEMLGVLDKFSIDKITECK